jgi:hypothetical protein
MRACAVTNIRKHEACHGYRGLFGLRDLKVSPQPVTVIHDHRIPKSVILSGASTLA